MVEASNEKANSLAALMIDLDGTILGRGPLSPRVADAIACISGRVSVSIATGREAPDVLQIARRLGLTAPQICEGGASALNPLDGSRIWNSALPEYDAHAIIDALEKCGIPFIATHPDGSATHRAGISHWNLTRISAMDIGESLADELMARFSGNPDLNVVKVFLYYNQMWAVDFTPVGVDKGTAAGKLAALLGITTSQIGAIGDSYNDMPMLRICGLRIVMGDAPPEVKALADYVAPSVEQDGLAFALNEFVLPRVDGWNSSP